MRAAEQRSSVMQYDRRMGPSVRAALLAGFAVVFALWLLWGYQLVRSLSQIEQNVTSAHDSYVRGEETLSRIRTNVLLGSIYLRYALIDDAAPHRDAHRDHQTRMRNDVDDLLAPYEPPVSAPARRTRADPPR